MLQGVHQYIMELFYDHYQGNVSSLLNTKIRISKSQIPNIIGEANCCCSSAWEAYSGSLYHVYDTNWASSGWNKGGNSDTQLWIDASLSSDRYGTYTEVNPLYQSCIFCIKF